MDELRSIWTQYSELKSPTDQAKYNKSKRAAIQSIYDEMYAIGGESSTFFAGPHWARGIDSMNTALRRYWETGVVAGNASDIKALGPECGFSNPMSTYPRITFLIRSGHW
jgi:hypothetical protein